MDETLSTYTEFTNRTTAEQAVRALKAAGFNRIEIDDLSHGMNSATDGAEAPIKKTWKFTLAGICLGVLFGCAWGILVFGLPAWLLDVHYSAALIAVGFIFCVGVGAVIGVEQAYVLVGRWSPDPTSVLDGDPVGVRVFSDYGAQLIRAREILNLFVDVGPSEKRWWRFRRWSHSIGT
jgi:hypothetical protein